MKEGVFLFVSEKNTSLLYWKTELIQKSQMHCTWILWVLLMLKSCHQHDCWVHALHGWATKLCFTYSRLLINAYSWEASGSLLHLKLEQALPPKPGLLTIFQLFQPIPKTSSLTQKVRPFCPSINRERGEMQIRIRISSWTHTLFHLQDLDHKAIHSS